MKRLLISILALIPMMMGAQELNVLYTHPASNGTKTLSVEDATMNRNLYPQRPMREIPAELGFDGRSPMAAFMGGPGAKRPGAFTKDQSLYFRTESGEEFPIAISENSQISYGTSVSRNEFGINGGIFMSNSKQKIAFYRKDESRVTDFPLLDINTRTGELMNKKYPMNGMESERVDLGIYDFNTKKTIYVQAEEYDYDRFLTNICWSPDDKYVFIQVLDRSQHHMKLNMYRADDGSFVRTLLTEDDDRWVEPYEPLHFIKNSYDFIYSIDTRDGYKNLYLCDTLGTVRRLTAVDADVKYLDNNGKTVFYTSAEVSPVENHLFRIDILNAKKGKFSKPVQLTKAQGWHSVTLGKDYKYFLDSYSNFTTPSAAELRSAVDGKLVRELGKAEDPLTEYATGEMRFGTVKSADGKYDNNFFMLLPPDFDPSKKYPVVLYVYGGPHSQLVKDSWLGGASMWDIMMAQKGYIVYTQDNRGTQNRGAEYEKAINRQCGQAEMADQMVGINALKNLPYVDANRIGVDGWSYGGFMTISLITNFPETFKVAVAGGPVIDWKWYEIMYGERYMDTMETNPEGFAKTSLINKAKDLKGKLLVIQGAIDDTVVWEHSLSFVQECIENNIPVEYFPYPRSEHNVAGKWRVHLNQKITDYFVNNL